MACFSESLDDFFANHRINYFLQNYFKFNSKLKISQPIRTKLPKIINPVFKQGFIYRFLHCCGLRALRKPNFLVSTILGSRFK